MVQKFKSSACTHGAGNPVPQLRDPAAAGRDHPDLGNDPKRIVLSRPDRIGDVILSTACVEPVRNRFPDAELFFLAAPEMSDLLEENPSLNGLILLPSPTMRFWSRVKTLASQIKARDITILVHLQPDRLVAWAGWLARVPLRVGFARGWPRLLTHSVPYRKQFGEKHESRFAFELLNLIGVEEPEHLSADIYPTKSARDTLPEDLAGQSNGAKMAVFHLGAYGHKIGLPLDLMLRIALWLIESYGWEIVLIGGEDEGPVGENFCRRLREKSKIVWNLIGRLNLAQTAWLLQKTRLFIGRDSGPAHLAAAMCCPTITLFGAPRPVDSARRWSPLGPRTIIVENSVSARWWENTEGKAAKNRAGITFEEVKNSVEIVLAR